MRNEFFDTLIIFIADWLVWWMIFAVLAFALFKKISWKLGTQIIATAVFAWALTEVFQIFYSSPRPFLILDDVRLLFIHGAYDSFPSGTTAFAFALATAFYLESRFLNKKIGAFFLIGAILIGLSRVIVGIHWPIDVLFGGVFGIGAVIVVQKLIRYFYKNACK